jgi:hypothetical protein
MIYKLDVPGPIEDVEEVRVLEWQGEAGRVFAPGDLIVELETHKAVVEVRAGQPGVLGGILSPAGDWQKLGQPHYFAILLISCEYLFLSATLAMRLCIICTPLRCAVI